MPERKPRGWYRVVLEGLSLEERKAVDCYIEEKRRVDRLFHDRWDNSMAAIIIGMALIFVGVALAAATHEGTCAPTENKVEDLERRATELKEKCIERVICSCEDEIREVVP